MQYLGEDSRVDERDESGADNRYVFKTPSNRVFYIFTKGKGEVWINVSALRTGDNGSAIYDAASNFAFNTNRVFIGDPKGLTTDSIIRRTTNMLSTALRFGTTKHIAAAKEQIEGSKKDGIEPLEWKGSDVDKINALIHTFLTTLHNQFPEIKGYRYDYSRRNRFVDSRGRPLDAKRLERGKRTKNARASRVGETTMRRAIFLQSLISSESSERPGLLEKFLNGTASLMSKGQLNGIFSENPLHSTTNTRSARELLSILPVGAKKLYKNGSLEIVETIKKLPENLQKETTEGVYDPLTDTVYLVADNLTKENVLPTLYHELFHKRLAGDANLRKQLESAEAGLRDILLLLF